MIRWNEAEDGLPGFFAEQNKDSPLCRRDVLPLKIALFLNLGLNSNKAALSVID